MTVVIHATFEQAVKAGGRVFEVMAVCHCADGCRSTRYATGGDEAAVREAASEQFDEHAIHLEDLGDEPICQGCGKSFPSDVIVWIDGDELCAGCDRKRMEGGAQNARDEHQWELGKQDFKEGRA